MHEPELPTHVMQALEQRVKRRIRRQVIMAALTLSFFISLLMGSTIPSYMGGHAWGIAAGLLFVIWAPYTLWYIYRALVERGIQREIEREYQRQLQLARAGRRFKREERYAHLAGLVDDREAFLADDGELWFEDEDKPKRRLDF